MAMTYNRTRMEKNLLHERFSRYPESTSLTELLGILLAYGSQPKEETPLELAAKISKVLLPATGASRIDGLHYTDLLNEIPGITENKAIMLCAAIELGRRLSSLQGKRKLVPMNTPERVAAYFMEKLRHETQEHFVACYLNVQNRMLGYRTISVGTLWNVPVDTKEILKWAARYNAASLIVLHNHPSGSPAPSKEDIDVTHKLSAAALLLDIPLTDHVIIGDGVYVSLHERGVV